jgi:hypothetical protein
MRSARQIAAAKRNIKKAQARSAQLRRGGAGKGGSTSFYGKGRAGRKAARRATYGSKKNGLSIAQQQRRRQRTNKWKRRASFVGTAITIGAGLYGSTNQTQREYARYAAKSGLNTLKTKYKYHTSGMGGQIRRSRKK